MAALSILITSQHCPAARQLASALLAHGAGVDLVEHDAASDRSTIAERLASGEGRDLVIVFAMPEHLAPVPLVDLDEDQWRAATDQPMRAALYAFQAALALLGGSGSILCVGPSVGVTGAAQLTPLATLAEGQRALVKSAARQWGHAGITVNFVGMTTAALLPELAGVALPETPEMGPMGPVIGRRPGFDDLAALALFLAGPGGRAHTGASFTLDGGEWMLP